MSNAYFKVPEPINEPVKTYAPGTPERASIIKKLKEMESHQIEVPLIIGGKEVKTGNTAEMRAPHDHSQVLGVYHKAGKKEVGKAIEAALEARKSWADMPWEHRVSIFLKAADLLAGPWRSYLMRRQCWDNRKQYINLKLMQWRNFAISGDLMHII